MSTNSSWGQRGLPRLTSATPRSRRADTLAYKAGHIVVVTAPGVVTNLSAAGGIAQTALSWSMTAQAVSYDVESAPATSGPFTSIGSVAGLGSSVIGLGFIDSMASTSALTYYRVRARNSMGTGAYSSTASAIATALSAPSASALIPVPTNLRRQRLWVSASSKGTDILSWNASAGATAYIILEYDLEIGRVTGVNGAAPLTTFTVPATSAAGLTYTVCALTAQGQSIASNICAPAFPFPPGSPPSWASQSAPNTVLNLLALPQWNSGAPTVLIRWGGQGSGGISFNIYRNNVLLASGLTACSFLDTSVISGLVYTYTVTSVNELHEPALESVKSTVATVTTLSAQLSLSSIVIPITRIVSRDDAAFVFFNKVAGALDYVCFKYVAGTAPEVSMQNGKAAGEWRGTPNGYVATAPEPTEMCIQMNDIDPVNPTMLRVAALDKLVRFQTQDGMMTMSMGMTGAVPGGPASPSMQNHFIAQINGPVATDGFVKNGQGDPANVPNIIALSAPFSASCTPFALTGTDGHGGAAFLDRFRTGDNEPILAVPIDPSIAQYATDNPALLVNNPKVQSFQTPKWNFTNYTLDNAMTKLFFMPHFMSVVYDGGGPGAPFNRGQATANNYGLHIANGSMTMQPRAADGSNWFGDISGGKVLHITMEVDAHVNTRRFLLITLKGRGQQVFSAAPTKMHDDDLRQANRATTDANFFAWIIGLGSNDITLFRNNGSATGIPYDHLHPVAPLDYNDAQALARSALFGAEPRANGTARDLDKMHRFHLYVSATRMRIVEETPEGPFSVVYDRPFANGVSLPWTQIEPVFVHEIYHTGIDALDGEMYGGAAFAGGPENMHWVNNRPYADERHWDNMGAEVLSGFPAEPLELQASTVSLTAGASTTIHATFAPGTLTHSSTRFALGAATAGSSVTSFTATSDTTADVVVLAGAAGAMRLCLLNSYFNRSIVITAA